MIRLTKHRDVIIYISRVLDPLFICVNYKPAWSQPLQHLLPNIRAKSCRALNKFRASFQNMKNVELKHNS